MIVLLVGLVVVGSSALTAWFFARRHAWRWGELPGAPAVVLAGAYRSAMVTSPGVPRGTPAVVPWAAGVGFVWAALTFLVFAPAGLLLALITADEVGSPAALAVIAVSLSGFALAVTLVVAGVRMLRCKPGAQALARFVAGWSLVHHGAVLVTMLCLWTAEPSWDFLPWSVVPCIVGGLHALALRAAGALPGPAVLHDGSA